MSIWLAMGIAIGTAMGSATHHMGRWVAIAAALGVLFAICARCAPRQ